MLSAHCPRSGALQSPSVQVRAAIENPLPRSLPADRGTAVFCFGHCFDRHDKVVGLELLVDGARRRPAAVGMPRRDLYEWLHRNTSEDPEGRSYRSGFWATVPIPAREGPGRVELAAEVSLAGGAQGRFPLGEIEIVEPWRAERWERGALPAGTVAICMATYEPDPALFQIQVQSLRDQTDGRWVCVISDDGSDEDHLRRMRQVIGEDPRFTLVRGSERVGPYRNFERALRAAPADAELLALCDQDDRWYPDKLARLRAALGSARLAFCDQRLVGPDGSVLRESLWRGRRNEHANLASMLVANSIPGASMLLRREVAEAALPFPLAPGDAYHDHWLALVALASGEIAYVDRPLYDYVQHVGAVSGDLVARDRPLRLAGSRGLRSAYFGGYLTREVLAQTLLLRCDASLTGDKRRALERFIASGSSAADFLWLAGRPLRRLIGRDETLGGEFPLARGILWRWMLPLAVGRGWPPKVRSYDASFPDPPRFEQPRLRRWRAGL